ncbi:MAG: M48 family metalloprotease [Acidobacteriota bacterium]
MTTALAVLVGGEAMAQRTETFRGYAEWLRGDTLIVDGQRVAVSRGTTLKGLARHGVGSVELGSEITVKGVREPGGIVRATEIEAKTNGASFLEREILGATNSQELEWLADGRVTADDDSGSRTIGRIYDDGADVRRVERVLDRVLPPYADRGSYRAYVVDNKEWNAMAMANGSVWVFRGLLDAFDDDELAIVVGHEVAHVTHEHTRREMKRTFWIQGVALAAIFAAEQIDHDVARGAVQIGAGLTAVAFANRYSRDHEHQADRVGLRYAYEGGFDVSKAPHLWERFREKYGDDPKLLNALFGSHPLESERVGRLEREIGWNYR